MLGTLAPKFSLGGPDDFLGKNFASLGFALSLLGSFDGCHFFVPTEADRKIAQQALAGLGGQGLEVFCALELPERIATEGYSVFHVPDVFPDMAAICHLRRKLGASFQVTALIHSISYPSLERDTLNLLMAPTTDADLVLCSSQAGLEALLRIFAHVRTISGLAGPVDLSMAVVPLAVDTARFAPGDRHLARAAVGLADDRHYFLSVARLSIADKLDVGPLLEAFRRAQEQIADRWDLVLAGGSRDANYLQFLQEQVRDRELQGRVHVLADFADELKPDLYAACDVFVSPSDNLQETFGLAVVEAMASGLPIISSDWDGYKDTVDAEVGCRIPTYMPAFSSILANRRILDNSLLHLLVAQSVAIDVSRLASAMRELASDPELRAKRATAARERALRKYDRETIAAHVRNLLAMPPDPSEESLAQVLQSYKTQGGDPYELFSAHPTRQLRADDRLSTSDLGQLAVEREVKLYLCEEMQHLLNVDLLRPILRACREPQLLSAISDRFDSSPERLLYSVYWLVKQGLLDVEDPPAVH